MNEINGSSLSLGPACHLSHVTLPPLSIPNKESVRGRFHVTMIGGRYDSHIGINVGNEHEEKIRQNLEEELIQHIQSYPIQLQFPAKVFSSEVSGDASSYLNSSTSPRTSEDFINYRLLDSGLKFHDQDDDGVGAREQSIAEVSTALANFVSDMNKTGCYDSVQVILGRRMTESLQPEVQQPKVAQQQAADQYLRQVDVILNEKRWYKLYIGGGIKPVSATSSFGITPNDFGILPKLQFETSGSLINLTGHCDMTSISYSLDQGSIPSLSFSHSRPFYTLFHKNNMMKDFILGADQGSKVTATFRADMDTVDYDHIRSCKDHHQSVGIRISNQNMHQQAILDGAYQFIDWSLTFRDIRTNRKSTWPYLTDASPEIVASSGPSLKNSITFESRMNGSHLDDKFNPTSGVDAHVGAEIAGPPGDVGFFKLWGGGSFHVPLTHFYGMAFHLALNTGILSPLQFAGACSNSGLTCINDRFFIGGPNQLRGFVPGGIGPRAKTGGSISPGGDSLGGDIFYTAIGALSFPLPGVPSARAFLFTNTGTLTGFPISNWSALLKTTRVSVGAGLSLATPMGRVEATYSIPMRYGPMDARRYIQLGVGLNFS